MHPAVLPGLPGIVQGSFHDHRDLATKPFQISFTCPITPICVPPFQNRCSGHASAASCFPAHLSGACIKSRENNVVQDCRLSMPGSLSSWLDDEPASGKNKARRPNLPANPNVGVARPAHLPPVIDVDRETLPPHAAAAPSGETKGGPSRRSTEKCAMPDSAEKNAWDPFGQGKSRTAGGARENALTRLRQAAAGRSSAAAASTATRTPSPLTPRGLAASSSWDPFACDSDGGKENRNAFSKLFAAAGQHQGNSSQGRSSGPAGMKRKRPTSSFLHNGNNSSATAVAAGGSGRGTDAVTRFCECPVCGKKVKTSLTPFSTSSTI